MSAQTDFGRISGTVIDPSGAALPGAKVTIENTDTQASRVVTTDDHGFYVAERLPIGPYTIFTNTAVTNNTTFNSPSPLDYRQDLGRFDYHISGRPGKSFLLSETWVTSPTVVNEAHAGASWNSQHYVTITSFATINGPATTLISPTAEIELTVISRTSPAASRPATPGAPCKPSVRISGFPTPSSSVSVSSAISRYTSSGRRLT